MNLNEINPWEHGLLDCRAKRLGISGWIVPLIINQDGIIQGVLWKNRSERLLAAPCIILQSPLCPSQERKLISQLQNWWDTTETLRLFEKRILLISGISNLSSAKFGLKKFKLLLKDVLILGLEEECSHRGIEMYFDCIIQACTNTCNNHKNRINYLRNLKRAHHDMNADGQLIPSVTGVAEKEQPHWVNASASNYQKWLRQAAAWSRIRYLNSLHSPIIINNWSSHLSWFNSPIQKKKTPIGKEDSFSNPPTIIQWGERRKTNIALMIHGFYLDKLEEILHKLPPGGNQNGLPGIDLYISIPSNDIDNAKKILQLQGWPRTYLAGIHNRGRDIAPFALHLLPEALRVGHTSFVKLHTKKSPHLRIGRTWSDYLINSLLEEKFLATLNDRLKQNPQLGLIAPAGTLLPSSVALGSNLDHLENLIKIKQWDGSWVLKQRYIAGSMMAGRLSALEPFKELELSINQFENEESQTDGTLAHALERLISWQVLSQNLTIQLLENQAESVPEFGYGWVR